MSYRGLQDVEICRPDTGHLRHSDTHTARYNMSDGMKGPSSVDDRGLNP